MNARFVAVNIQTAAGEPPAMPSLLLQVEEDVILYSQGWTHHVKRGALEGLTEADLRAALPVRANETLVLSPVYTLPPGDLMSPEMIQRVRQLWMEFVTGADRKEPLTRVS
jgi:hypothetical protein